MTPVARFFETTWWIWWLFAAMVIGRWCWITFLRDRHRHGGDTITWRELYRTALLERDPDRVKGRLVAAQEAILLELTSQLFRRDDPERRALQDAMTNLSTLQESAEIHPEARVPSTAPHRSAQRRRQRHSWGSWGSVQ